MKTKDVLAPVGCIAVVAAIPLLLAFGPWIADFLWYDYRNRSEFHSRRPHLEAIVRKLDREVLKPKQRVIYVFADRVEDVKPIDPGESPPRVPSDWTLFAERRADGHLRVEIRTFYRGRLGVWSLNYLSQVRSDEELRREERPWSVTRLDANWWAAVFSD